MDTPEDARLAETLASLTENTSDPVLLSTQISAAKTSLDRLLTDIGSPVEGNLIPVKTNILTRTQAPRSAAEGPQDRASVTRYAEGEAPPVKGMGFGAETPKTPQQAVRFETPGSPEYEAAVAKGLDMSQAGRMARMKEQGYDTPLFHKTDADIEAFDPERGGRGSTFFAGSPEGAEAGAGAGQNELRRLFARGDNDTSGAPRIMPVVTKSEGIAGLTLAPAQKQYWQSLPEEMPLSDYEKLKPEIDKNLGGIPYELYEDSYFVMPDGRKIEARDLKSLSDAEFEAVKQTGKEYLKKGPEPKRTYDEVKRTGRDLYGRQIAHYGIYSDEKAIAERYKGKGHTGYLVHDEGGLTVAIFDPSNIRSVNAAFDPEKSGSSTLLAAAPFAAVGGAGLTLAGEDARNQRTVGKPKTSQSARTVGKAKTN
jgi:hypothetical protein